MRKLIFPLLLLLLNMHAKFVYAQNRRADSLIHLLATTTTEDSGRARLLYRLAFIYVTSKPDSALLVAQQGLELSRKINFKRGESNCLSAIADVYTNTGNYPKSLEISLQALKIAEEMQDDKIIGGTLIDLSNVYTDEGDIKRSLDYAYKAISVFDKLHDSNSVCTILLNMGNMYENINQLDSALVYTRRGYLMAVSQNGASQEGQGLNNLGNVFLKLGKIDSAMAYYKSGTAYLIETNFDEGLSETYRGIAKIFLRKNKLDSCLYYAKLSFAMAKNGGFTDQLLATSNFLAEYYKSVRNIDSAYAYQAATIAAKDSLFSQQKANQFQNVTYDEAARQQQIEEAKEHERAALKQNALIGGLASLLIAAFLLFRNNRQKVKANQLLQKQKTEIDDKAQELSVQKDNVELLSEIGRKVTASLSVEKIIGTVYNNVNSLMDAAVFGIGIYNDNLKRIEFPATYENGEQLPFYTNSINDKNRFGAVCFTSGKEIIMGNLDKEHKDHVQAMATPHEGGQPVSIIFLPLIAKGERLGVITVQSFKENAYSDYHLFMLRNIATYTAIAIENAESYETLNRTVSTLRSTQSQLIQSEKMASLGELTAGIAHEIQNPLNFVNNFSEVNRELINELVEEVDKGNTKEAKAIANDIKINEEKINHHGKRADAIVKGMLQHSRSSSGVKEGTDINALADEYLRLAYHGLRAKDNSFNAIIKTDFGNAIGEINVIPQDIGRVLLNLYINAFYAAAERKKAEGIGYEPTINVSTKKSGNQILITVSDNGNGIPKNIVDKIFQPFFTTKPTGQGTGLGLSLSYDIIKAHGGEIKVETKDGEGSEFTIALFA